MNKKLQQAAQRVMEAVDAFDERAKYGLVFRSGPRFNYEDLVTIASVNPAIAEALRLWGEDHMKIPHKEWFTVELWARGEGFGSTAASDEPKPSPEALPMCHRLRLLDEIHKAHPDTGRNGSCAKRVLAELYARPNDGHSVKALSGGAKASGGARGGTGRALGVLADMGLAEQRGEEWFLGPAAWEGAP